MWLAGHARRMTTQPDIFTNVHKGLRRALFEVSVALGRADGEHGREHAARAMLRDVLHFVAHHGENEDLLLLPLLEARAPAVFGRIRDDHARIDGMLAALLDAHATAATDELYRRTCEFTAVYLEHVREEERLEPVIREVLTLDECVDFGRGSIARTVPEDQRMMLGWMLPAMTRTDADALLAKLPGPLAHELRPLTP